MNILNVMFYWNAKITLCKYQKQGIQSIRNKNEKNKAHTETNKTNVAVGAYLFMKKSRLYNTYHELLSEKWMIGAGVHSSTVRRLL